MIQLNIEIPECCEACVFCTGALQNSENDIECFRTKRWIRYLQGPRNEDCPLKETQEAETKEKVS